MDKMTDSRAAVMYFRKEMIARCREYAAGMAEIGADPHDLEAALAPLIASTRAPVGVEAGMFPGDVSREAAIIQLEDIARRASCGMPNIAGEILRVRTGLIIGHHTAQPTADEPVDEEAEAWASTSWPKIMGYTSQRN